MNQGTPSPYSENAGSRHRALDIANAFLDAWTGRDLAAAGSYLADDFTFDGPVARYRSAREFLAGSGAFAAGLSGSRSVLAAFGDEREALLLYDLGLLSGAAMRVADHYTVSDGKIQAEQILWDTYGQR